MPDSKAGHHKYQVTQASRDQHKSKQKGHVIHAGKDVHDAHLHVLDESGIAHFCILAGRFHGLVFLGKQLLYDGAVTGLYLCQRHMRRHQFKKRGGVQDDISLDGALKSHIEPAKLHGGGQGLRSRN